MSQITADINAFYLIQRLTQNHIMSLRPQRCVQRGVSRGCVYRGCVPRWVCPEGCVQRGVSRGVCPKGVPHERSVSVLCKLFFLNSRGTLRLAIHTMFLRNSWYFLTQMLPKYDAFHVFPQRAQNDQSPKFGVCVPNAVRKECHN